MAGGDVEWPPGFTPVTPNAPSSIVRTTPPAGAPPTDVPPQSNGQWPQGFTPVEKPNSTVAPTPAPDATSQPPAPPPTWGEAFGAMVDPKKLKDSFVKLGQDIIEGGTKKIHEVVADPLGAAESVVRKGLEPFSTPGGPTAWAAGRVAKPFLNDEMKAKVTQVLGGKVDDGDPLVQMLIDRYGSLDKLKQTMHDDPAGTWLDLTTALSGGEALAARAGLKTTAKVLGAGAALDPMTAASRFVVEPILAKAVPKTLGWRSGVGPEVVTEIKDIHKPGTEAWNKYGAAGPNEFDAAFKGNIKPSQIVDRAEQGVKNMRKDAGAAYGLSKEEWIKHGGTFDFTAIENAQKDLIKSLHSSGGIDALEAPERARFNKLMETVDNVRKRGNWSIDDMDMLARRMQNFTTGFTDHPQMQRAAGEMKKAVRQSIYDSAPPGAYKEGLQNYHAAMNDLDELRSALSLGKDASEHTVMSKLQSVLRNNAATQYGGRQALVDILEKEGNVRLKPWLLGMATNVDAPRGITGSMAAGSGVAGAAGYFSGLGPIGVPLGIAADYYSRSPRLAARVGRTIGTHGDDMSSAFPLARYAPIAVGHADREEDLKKQGRARGGRVGYADGGEVMEDDALAANPAVGRVRRSYFTPVSVTNPVKLSASKAVFADPLKPMLPTLPSSGTSKAADGTTGGGVMGSIANLWNAPFEQKRRQEETARKEEAERLRKEAVDLEKQKAALPGGAQAKADGTAPAPGTTPGGGVLQGTPIPGDTYEAKVGSFESSGSDTAVNKTSGAAGRYQFMPSTAEGLRKQFPDLKISDQWRTNPEDQQKLMKAYTDISRDALRKALGREPTGGELYALHLFGHGKGPSIVAGGNAPLISLTTEQERSGNPFLSNFKTAADLIAYFNKRFG